MLNDLPSRSAQAQRPWLLASAVFVAAILATLVTGCGPASVSAVGRHNSTTGPTAKANGAGEAEPNSPMKAKPGFPPKTLAAFRAFAATGDASQVHQLATSSKGLPSCPDPNFYVAVSPALDGRVLESDLSAFFIEKGLLTNRCEAFVFAYHGRSDYRAHHNDGYTVGRVAVTASGSERNLEVDTGSATSFGQPRFNFNFNF